MYNKIKNICNSPVVLLGILAIVLCMVVTSLVFKDYHEWTPLAVTATVIGMIVLVGCLAWSAHAYITNKDVNVMNPKWRVAVVACGGILTLIWLYINTNLFITAVWVPFWIWEVAMSVRDARGAVE